MRMTCHPPDFSYLEPGLRQATGYTERDDYYQKSYLIRGR